MPSASSAEAEMKNVKRRASTSAGSVPESYSRGSLGVMDRTVPSSLQSKLTELLGMLSD